MSAATTDRHEERRAERLRETTRAILATPAHRASRPRPELIPCQGFTFAHVRRMVARSGIKRRVGAVPVSRLEAYDATRGGFDAATFRESMMRRRSAARRMGR